jgi:hypothetical protein
VVSVLISGYKKIGKVAPHLPDRFPDSDPQVDGTGGGSAAYSAGFGGMTDTKVRPPRDT